MLMTETPAQVPRPAPRRRAVMLPTMSLKLVLLASTRMIWPGAAMAWAHSTSRLSSTAQPVEPETAG